MSEPQQKSFEEKVAGLIAATRHLEIAQILVLRRLTLRDPESLRWANERQLTAIFNVIITRAMERLGVARLRDARDRKFLPLLPPSSENRDDDVRILTEAAVPFLGGANAEAEAAQASFEALLTQRLITPPHARSPRQHHPIKETPPLFAAQIGPKNARGKPIAVIEAPPPPAQDSESEAEAVAFTDFPTLFDNTICEYARSVLDVLRVASPRPGVRLPFLVAPEFATVYEEVLRRFVLPTMRTSRHVQSLANNYNWAEVGGSKLIEILQGGEVNNPILHNWDSRWSSMKISKVVGKLKKPRPEDNPWPLLREEATRCNYEAPPEDNTRLLQDIIRFEIESITKSWKEIGHLYQQEFAPSGRMDQAREGALRDGLMKWVAKLPENLGEFLAIKAHFEFPHCDVPYMQKLLTNFGRSDSERRRNAPYLAAFLVGLG
jgi:hypothetical protein